MMNPGKCWHLVNKKLTQQCGIEARRYLVQRPNVNTSASHYATGPVVFMWLCPLHVTSVKEKGYEVILDSKPDDKVQ